jgi:hypothetical protein
MTSVGLCRRQSWRREQFRIFALPRFRDQVFSGWLDQQETSIFTTSPSFDFVLSGMLILSLRISSR